MELSRAWEPLDSLSFRKIMKDQASTVCFLMEDKKGFKQHCGDLSFPNQVIVKKPDSRRGLALLWKDEVMVDVINFIENHILAKVVKEDGFQYYLTCFYRCQKRVRSQNLGHCFLTWLPSLMVHGCALVTLMLFYTPLRN